MKETTQSAIQSAVLARIRRSLGVNGNEAERRAIVRERLKKTPRGVIPKRGQVSQSERITLFCQMAEKYAASVERLSSYDDVPCAIAAYLRERNLPASLRHGDDERLTRLPWSGALSVQMEPFERQEFAPNQKVRRVKRLDGKLKCSNQAQIEIKKGPSDGNDLVGLSHAFGGIAESGTVMMLSGPDNPTTLNFLPDIHLVLISADRIVGDYETLWQMLREEYAGESFMPRAINLITGPSRSADIAQTLILGAHGPRALHIMII